MIKKKGKGKGKKVASDNDGRCEEMDHECRKKSGEM
jgi:hypothetical protein